MQSNPAYLGVENSRVNPIVHPTDVRWILGLTQEFPTSPYDRNNGLYAVIKCDVGQ